MQGNRKSSVTDCKKKVTEFAFSSIYTIRIQYIQVVVVAVNCEKVMENCYLFGVKSWDLG